MTPTSMGEVWKTDGLVDIQLGNMTDPNVSEGEEYRVGDGQMNSESIQVLHFKGNLGIYIAGKLMTNYPSSCSGAKQARNK